ncbi:MAG: tRNA (adenosine(37)-N6)-threonylcarbamoyltransferase complex ATPase subunit type 1 TsaE [Xanthomonadales bacterium]|nr:tRNA (adenosine(37)-N6)-threonylcarbamoyltransferase complex ATPase subunit type 1 TsaE [Xanthomonadales bacterium]
MPRPAISSRRSRASGACWPRTLRAVCPRCSTVTPPAPDPAWQLAVPDESAVARLAAAFAAELRPPMVVYLVGDLGAGKTTFARAYVHALGFEGYVKSPSYGLLETYETGGQCVLHLDLYRIEDPEELEYLAIRDLYRGNSVLLVEWPDRGANYLPIPDLVLEFSETNESRFIRCTAHSEAGRGLAKAVSDAG